MKRAVTCLLLAGLGGALGCYHLGPVGKNTPRSVAVPMFKNRTLKPQLEAQVTNAIIKRLQADGSVRVDRPANADVVVTGVITRYQRDMLRTQKTDTSVTREYRLGIEALVEARDRTTGAVLLKPTTLTGHADSFLGNDLQSAEEQALPLIADDLARQVVRLLVEGW